MTVSVKDIENIELVEVVSSNVVAVGYDEESRRLVVKFKSGTYVYHDVPKTMHTKLMEDDSKGHFLNQHIKGNYTFDKVVA